MEDSRTESHRKFFTFDGIFQIETHRVTPTAPNRKQPERLVTSTLLDASHLIESARRIRQAVRITIEIVTQAFAGGERKLDVAVTDMLHKLSNLEHFIRYNRVCYQDGARRLELRYFNVSSGTRCEA